MLMSLKNRVRAAHERVARPKPATSTHVLYNGRRDSPNRFFSLLYQKFVTIFKFWRRWSNHNKFSYAAKLILSPENSM